MVNHEKQWDIKDKESWEYTIGTDYPGYGAYVLFRGMVMTLDELGNYTYGRIGRAYDFNADALIMGSYYAAGSPEMGNALWEEESDWPYIIDGYWSI